MDVLLASSPHRDTFGYSMPPPGLLRLGGELCGAGSTCGSTISRYRLAAGELPRRRRSCASAAERILRARAVRRRSGSPSWARRCLRARDRRARARARAAHADLARRPGPAGIDVALVERFAQVDAVVRGEGEETLPRLLDALASGAARAGVAGITWRDADGRVRREADREPIGDLGSPAASTRGSSCRRSRAYKRITGEAEGLVPIDSGRGCVYDCSFCTIGRFWSRRSRTLPARGSSRGDSRSRHAGGAKRVPVPRHLRREPRPRARVLRRADRARRAVPWEVRARADHLDRELLERMGRAGCYRVLFGVESADARRARAHQKGMRARRRHARRVVDDCARAGITPILSMILGLPGEDERRARARARLAARAAALRARRATSRCTSSTRSPAAGSARSSARTRAPVEGIPPDMACGAGETAAERALIAAHPDLFTTFALLTPAGADDARCASCIAIATELPRDAHALPAHVRAAARARRRRVRGALETVPRVEAQRAELRGLRAARGARAGRATCSAWEQALVRTGAARAVRRRALAAVRAQRGDRARPSTLPRVARRRRAPATRAAAARARRRRCSRSCRAPAAPLSGVATLARHARRRSPCLSARSTVRARDEGLARRPASRARSSSPHATGRPAPNASGDIDP